MVGHEPRHTTNTLNPLKMLHNNNFFKGKKKRKKKEKDESNNASDDSTNYKEEKSMQGRDACMSSSIIIHSIHPSSWQYNPQLWNQH